MKTIVMIDKIVSVDLYPSTLKAVINTIGGGFINVKFEDEHEILCFTGLLAGDHDTFSPKTITIIDDVFAY